jgi:sugar/nucleoside kinase (ribokinase family)
MAEITVVGHIAIDTIVTPRGTGDQLGGPPTYLALVAGTFSKGFDAVTKFGDDLPKDLRFHLTDLGLGLENMVAGALTTRFTLDYTGPRRALKVKSICEEIRPEDFTGTPEAALITPIIGEVSASTVASLSPDVMALDPQGFLREPLEDGSIRLRPWSDSEVLGKVDVFRSSLRELKLVTGESDVWRGLEAVLERGTSVAIATKGAEGALLETGDARFLVPAHEATPVDPTGAGDAFLGCFLMEYLEGEEPLWCASMGTAVASFIVETRGAQIHASPKQIRERAEDVYNHSLKV